MQKNILIISAIFFFLEFYVFQAFKTLTGNVYARIAYCILTLCVYGFFFYEVMHFQRSDRDQHRVQILATLFLAFILPKVFIIFSLFVEDILRMVKYAYTFFAKPENYYPERRTFFSILGFGAAGIFSVLILDGVLFGKYRYKVRRVKLKIKGLPEAFKGYKVVQISDVHSGSFFHPEKLERAVRMINEENGDLVLFTGDMVNNYAEEFKPFVPLFKTIKAKDGKFSIFGNHDYGTYGDLKTEKELTDNLNQLIALEREAGFDLLRNEHRIIEKNGQKLYIIGVENWGEKPFPQYGDLNKASAGIPPEAAKILMSHDPTHFDYVVKKHPANIQLTLSGHTHGMQFGIDLKNLRWSPVEYRYPKWADLYESEGKFLYVNRGFGVIGYPGRVGIDPEITVFELS